MKFNIESKIGARFKLIAHKGDGVPVRETEWFHNIVLDAGLDRMSVGTWIDRCCVGSGNSTPIATQISLDNFIASTLKQQKSVVSSQTTSKPYYRSAKVTWRFNPGVAAGNISEVGLGWGDQNLWNRALIRDENGNPTTITVLSDEYLDVVSEVRDYPADSFRGSFNLVGKNGAIISTHTYIGYRYINQVSPSFGKIEIALSVVGSGDIDDTATGGISGASTNLNTEAHSISYPSPRVLRTVLNINLTQAIFNHKSILVRTSILGDTGGTNSGYKLQINPPITKTITQTMIYTFEVSWGRYEPT